MSEIDYELLGYAFRAGWKSCIAAIREGTTDVALILPDGQTREITQRLVDAFSQFEQDMGPKIDAILAEHLC